MEEHYAQFYRDSTDRYEALVRREDAAGHLRVCLEEAADWASSEVVELGAGTGRLSAMLAPLARRWTAFDGSHAMLRVARAKGLPMKLAVADHRALPLPAACADVVLEGWAFGHLVEAGLDQAERGLEEMRRVARPGARLIVVETLGTGVETPAPPTKLEPFYALLAAQGFEGQVVRTDYAFASVEEAEALLGAFFGPRVTPARSVPECTGVWIR